MELKTYVKKIFVKVVNLLLRVIILIYLEIDAASKTSVDDVRELIEFSRYKPTSVKYKIFICDEVHMFSKSAFAALLKTLKNLLYLKFIFASTEVKKFR